MGMFIKVELDKAKCAPDGGERLVGICPVRVFRLQDGHVVIDPDYEDECTLCGLCLQTYPKGAVTIRRLYRDE